MADLIFRVVVRDDGSAVIQRFGDNVKRAGVRAKKAGGVISRSFSKARGAVSSMTKAAFSLRGALVAVGFAVAARAATRFTKSVLDAGDVIEKAQIRLRAMKGSTDIAAAAFKNFEDVAAKVPFTLESVIEAGVTLEAFGAKSEDTLAAVTDLAAFMGTDLVFAAQSFGRAFAAGAGAADVLRERGVLATIQLRTGIDDLTKLSLPELRKALIDAMVDPLGPIAGQTRNLAQTFTGQISLMQDVLFKFRKTFAQVALLPAAKVLLENLRIVAKAIGQTFGTKPLEDFGKGVADIIPSFQTLIKASFTILRAVTRLKVVFTAFKLVGISALEGINLVFLGLVKASFEGAKLIVRALDSVLQGFVSLASGMVKALGVIIQRFADLAFNVPGLEDVSAGLQIAADKTFNFATATGKLKVETGLLADVEQSQKDLVGDLVERTKALDNVRAKLVQTLKEQSSELVNIDDQEQIALANATALAKSIEKEKQLLKEINTQREENVAKQKVADEERRFRTGEFERFREQLAASAIEDLFNQGVLVSEEEQRQFEKKLEQEMLNEEQLLALRRAFIARQLGLQKVADNVERQQSLRQTAGKLEILKRFNAAAITLANTFGGQNIILQKGLATAEVAIATAVAVMKALASGPVGSPPNFALAAAVAAMGAAQIAAIAAAQPGGGGNVAGVTETGGGGVPGGVEALPEVPLDPEERTPTIINVNVDGFIGNQDELVSALARVIRESVNDDVDFGLQTTRV